MKNQVLVKRYTQGLVNSITDEREYSSLIDQLNKINQLFSGQKDMEKIFMRPFLSTTKKLTLAKNILKEMDIQDKIYRFFLLLIEHDRLELLPDILDKLPDMWNEKKGIVTFEVFSVVSLTDDQKNNLHKKLERLEHGPVDLKYRIDESLLGGLSIKKGNLVYDISLRGDLEKILENISQG